MLPGKYIVIEGNIGAGKTSLASLLSQKFKTSLLLEEFAENTFLPQFYKDPERFAFPLEMSFMAERYSQLKKMFAALDQNHQLVSDFVFEKSLLFARVNLKEDEFRLFENFYNLVKDSIPKPNLLVYLKKEVVHLQKNISKRGRSFEKEIKGEYLHKINESYNLFLESDSSINKLIIHASDMDFVTRKTDFETIVNKILEHGVLN